MTAGRSPATALLVAWSQVRTVGQLYAVLVGIGVAMAMVLYEPALAVIVSWFDPARRATRAARRHRRRRLRQHHLHAAHRRCSSTAYGWRTTLLVLAASTARHRPAARARRPPAATAPAGATRAPTPAARRGLVRGGAARRAGSGASPSRSSPTAPR